MPTQSKSEPKPSISPLLTFLFALSAGAAVGNLYLAQPLLDFIAKDLHASSTAAGILVTATQVGYAIGILLIVPLGDVHDRKRLIPLMMLLAAVSLFLCAIAPTMLVLLLTIFAVGLTTVSGQLLTPLAGDLANDSNRGKVVGTVVSGLVTGILVSRTISGLVAGVAGWRALFVFAAVLDVILAVILFRNLPRLEPKTSVKYSKLITSVGQVVVRERIVRWTLALGALSMCMFTMLWTSLTFFLSAPPFNYSVSIIGLFGLAGIAGAIAVQRLSKFHDRGWNLRLTGIATVLDIISFLISFFIGHSVIGIIVVLVLFDIATQTLNIMNQARVFSISHSARSRLNTAYVTSNFIGGAIGSFLAGILWSADDWKAISIGGIVLALSACTIWMLGHRGGGLHIQVKA